jgi:hypothetical protein
VQLLLAAPQGLPLEVVGLSRGTARMLTRRVRPGRQAPGVLVRVGRTHAGCSRKARVAAANSGELKML